MVKFAIYGPGLIPIGTPIHGLYNIFPTSRKSTHLISFVSSNAKVVSLKLFTQLTLFSSTEIYLDLLFLNANLIVNNRASLISLYSKLVYTQWQRGGILPNLLFFKREIVRLGSNMDHISVNLAFGRREKIFGV